jgi:hypothetical protein
MTSVRGINPAIPTVVTGATGQGKPVQDTKSGYDPSIGSVKSESQFDAPSATVTGGAGYSSSASGVYDSGDRSTTLAPGSGSGVAGPRQTGVNGSSSQLERGPVGFLWMGFITLGLVALM